MKRLLPVFFISFFFLLKVSPLLAAQIIENSQSSEPQKEEQEENECLPNEVEIEKPQNSRVAPCNLCCPRPEPLTTSCATTFTLYKNISFPKNTSQEKIPWESRFIVDPTSASLPFAGKNQEESENQYLADYLEGTNEYYQNYGNLTTLTNYQGVLKKLTPFEYQNQLKKQLIARASENTEEEKENRIHNYQVKYVGRLCWNTPLWLDAARQIADWLIKKALNINLPDTGHFCLYEDKDASGYLGMLIVKGNNIINFIPGVEETRNFISGLPGMIHVYDSSTYQESLTTLAEHLPPDPNEENYLENYNVWKNEDGGKWYYLWQVVPMLSREDTPGEIKPYIGENPDVTLTIDNEDTLVEKIPHLARLFEASQEVNNILIPKTPEEIEKPTSQDFAETNPPAECFKENYLMGEGDNLCCEQIPGMVEGQFENPYFDQCASQNATPSAECYGEATETVTQGVGVKLSHPYLDEIWNNTASPLLGFFNIFRPHQVPAFEDIDAATTISYSSSGSEVSPQEGLFFYPHLGGVQKAKEWVVNQALWPYEKKL